MRITINGEPRQLLGTPPTVGDRLPKFTFTNKDGKTQDSSQLLGKPTVLSVVPDINTPVCSLQTKRFNEEVDQFPDINFLTISTNSVADQQKWCAAEGVKNMQLVSDASKSFGKASGLLLPEDGILARSVWLINKDGIITYRQIVKELVDEPNYDQVLAELKN